MYWEHISIHFDDCSFSNHTEQQFRTIIDCVAIAAAATVAVIVCVVVIVVVVVVLVVATLHKHVIS